MTAPEQALIDVHRARLRILTRQAAVQGMNTAPHVLIEIGEARTQIRALKAAARAAGYTVENLSIDEEVARPQAPRPTAGPAPASPDRALLIRQRMRQIEALLSEIEQLL